MAPFENLNKQKSKHSYFTTTVTKLNHKKKTREKKETLIELTSIPPNLINNTIHPL